MRRSLTTVATAVVLLGLAAQAPAATITGKVRENSQGTDRGTMEFRAGGGIKNRVTVTPQPNREAYLVRERSERLKARGACKQVDRHTARCPQTESEVQVELVLGGRADRVEVERCRQRFGCYVAVVARGGAGDDVLSGGGEFYGDRGDDVLRGARRGRSGDSFHGGPGKDLMVGHGIRSRFAEDSFYDDETDAQATRDVIRGGKNARALIDYSMRERNLRIDLRDSRLAPEGDRVSGVKSVTTGAGDDTLIGTGGASVLAGGAGDDHLDGRGGDDVLGGGAGDDTVLGKEGDDRLDGISALQEGAASPSGSDRLTGGPGSDEMRSLDSLDDPDAEIWPDDVQCDTDDLPVTSDPLDLLRDCEQMLAWDLGVSGFRMEVVPQLTAEGAVFTLRCTPTEFDAGGQPSCRGELVVTSVTGTEYGRQGFQFEPENFEWPEVTVTVPVSDAGRAAIEANEVIGVQVNAFSSSGFRFPPSGYRARLGAA